MGGIVKASVVTGLLLAVTAVCMQQARAQEPDDVATFAKIARRANIKAE
jgi:hypothetical protein